MDQLNCMRVFVRVARTGSFSAAAKEEGTTQGTISKQVAALEKLLGSRLLLRNQRDVGLTDVGRRYYDRCLSILREVDEAATIARSDSASPTGLLRVSMSPVLSRLVVAPILPGFLLAYPDVKIILKLTERHCDIIAEGIDVAIRARNLEDSALVARPLSSNPLSLAAAPCYLKKHGKPKHPNDLQDHNCLIFSRFRHPHRWRFARGKEEVTVPVEGNLRCDQGDTLIDLAVSGLGIALMPPWLMRDHLKAGRLQTILPGWKPPSLPLNVVYAKSPYLPVRTSCFTEFLRREVRRRKLLPA
jgi:DNA-binding transcriptional LysR family regulator